MIEADPRRIVVVGGGLTAGKAAAKLRTLGWEGELTVVTDEPHPPYERPPLSKDMLLHTDQRAESAYVQPEDWYADHDVDLRTSTRVTAIDLAGGLVRVGDSTLPYDRLLLATGSRARRLPHGTVSGAADQTITYLRTIEDSLRIRGRLIPGASVVMIGGGWISMEVAAAARTAGCHVTVLERGPLPLLRVLGREVAERFTGFIAATGSTSDRSRGSRPCRLAPTARAWCWRTVTRCLPTWSWWASAQNQTRISRRRPGWL